MYVLALALAGAMGGLQAQAAPPIAPANSAQAIYDTAQAAFDRGDWNLAITGFKALLPTDERTHLSPGKATISARLGRALLNVGRRTEARAAADRAIGALPRGEDLMEALLTSAGAADASQDYRDATQTYRRADVLAVERGDKAGMLEARAGLSVALMTVDPVAANSTLEAMLNDKVLLAHINKADLSNLQDLRARAAMNAGDIATAARWAERAIDTSGGLDFSRVSTNQVVIRTDAALISSLRSDDEKTRRYLTYTGAGHLKSINWVGRFEGDLPVCGEGDIRPQDSAVVEISIDPRGEVSRVVPLYVSRAGDLGATFARAVGAWKWDSDQLKGVPTFFLATLALQLRCQTRPTPDSLGRDATASLARWLVSRGVDFAPDEATGFVSADDTRLDRDDVAAVPALLGRLGRSSKGEDVAPRLLRILDAQHAPASAFALVLWKQSQAAGGSSLRAGGHHRAEVLAAGLSTLRQRFPTDPAIVWLELEEALAREQAAEFNVAGPLLRNVLATPEAILAADAPIRRVALLHASIVARMTGDTAGEQAKLAASGLNADQCLLFDTRPIPASLSIASAEFPAEAMRWRFEGYVREDFDISDNGRVANPRTIVAYPPLVFAKSAEAAVTAFRYVPPRIGGAAVGCTGETQGVSYRIAQ